MKSYTTKDWKKNGSATQWLCDGLGLLQIWSRSDDKWNEAKEMCLGHIEKAIYQCTYIHGEYIHFDVYKDTGTPECELHTHIHTYREIHIYINICVYMNRLANTFAELWFRGCCCRRFRCWCCCCNLKMWCGGFYLFERIWTHHEMQEKTTEMLLLKCWTRRCDHLNKIATNQQCECF